MLGRVIDRRNAPSRRSAWWTLSAARPHHRQRAARPGHRDQAPAARFLPVPASRPIPGAGRRRRARLGRQPRPAIHRRPRHAPRRAPGGAAPARPGTRTLTTARRQRRPATSPPGRTRGSAVAAGPRAVPAGNVPGGLAQAPGCLARTAGCEWTRSAGTGFDDVRLPGASGTGSPLPAAMRSFRERGTVPRPGHRCDSG
jgi:hypothetical protein